MEEPASISRKGSYPQMADEEKAKKDVCGGPYKVWSFKTRLGCSVRGASLDIGAA